MSENVRAVAKTHTFHFIVELHILSKCVCSFVDVQYECIKWCCHGFLALVLLTLCLFYQHQNSLQKTLRNVTKRYISPYPLIWGTRKFPIVNQVPPSDRAYWFYPRTLLKWWTLHQKMQQRVPKCFVQVKKWNFNIYIQIPSIWPHIGSIEA